MSANNNKPCKAPRRKILIRQNQQMRHAGEKLKMNPSKKFCRHYYISKSLENIISFHIL